MSGLVRLTMVSHGMTDAMAAGRFPVDEPLNALGRRRLADRAGGIREPTAAWTVVCGPELRTRQTSEEMGLDAVPDAALSDLDVGDWRGRPLDAVEPGDLAAWLRDPAATPHGGESVETLIERVRRWMRTLAVFPEKTPDTPGRVLAVTHPAVVRAAVLTALQAPPNSFWRIDVAPAARVELHHRGAGWTLRL